MATSLSIDSIDKNFWKSYSLLWHSSEGRSPFQSPSILQYFTSCSPGQVMAVQYSRDNKLLGAVLLKKEKSLLSFLSDLKTDANFFVFHKSCTVDDFEIFFTEFFKNIKARRWTLIFNNIPAWANYSNILELCGLKSGLFFQSVNYSVCPVVESNADPDIYKMVTRTHKHRYSYSRLKNKLNAEFEVLTDDQYLEEWVGEFISTHLLRWNNTRTPSQFNRVERHRFFLDCLTAWANDKVLVRFAVKVENKRIGFIVGLKEEYSLIHHSTTFNTGYRQYAPSKALVMVMAEWMLKNDLKILDFGDGDEEYKYFFANKERVLKRIMSTPKDHLHYILKAKLIKAVRKNQRFYNLYRNKLKIRLHR